jgi:GTP-binding protein HflX
VVHLPKLQPGTLFGSGKVAELKARIAADEVDLVLIDGTVSPVQQRNLEKEWGAKVLDRTGLILEIFADRARNPRGRPAGRTRRAQLPEAAGWFAAWTHLERQRGSGGMGFMSAARARPRSKATAAPVAGAGSWRLETAAGPGGRRRRELTPQPPSADAIAFPDGGARRIHQRRQVDASSMRITGAWRCSPRTCCSQLSTPPCASSCCRMGREVMILSDTVGFVSELPTQLVAAFRATLEEVHRRPT